jgi:hypothetical protein
MTPPRQSERAFGVTFAIVFVLIAAAGYFFFDARPTWALVLAGGFLAVAFLAPWVLLPLNRLWTKFAGRLGQANNFILLGAFFYIFVLPAGLIMRLFADPMRRKADPAATTYWSPVVRKADPETYRDLF